MLTSILKLSCCYCYGQCFKNIFPPHHWLELIVHPISTIAAAGQPFSPRQLRFTYDSGLLLQLSLATVSNRLSRWVCWLQHVTQECCSLYICLLWATNVVVLKFLRRNRAYRIPSHRFRFSKLRWGCNNVRITCQSQAKDATKSKGELN